MNMKKGLMILFCALMICSSISCTKKNTEKTLRIVGFDLREIQDYIDQFKLENPDIKISVTDYYDYSDYIGSIEKLNSSMLASDCGDIFICGDSYNIENLIKNDFVWDMNNSEKIRELSNKLSPNILECCKFEDKLVTLFPCYDVTCFLCKSKNDIWDTDNIILTLNEHIEKNDNLFANYSEDVYCDILCTMLTEDIESLNSPNIRSKYIEIINDFGKLKEISDKDNIDFSIDSSYLSNDSIIYMQDNIGQFSEIGFLSQNCFNDKITAHGYPLKEESFIITIPVRFMILNKSKNKDIACDFITNCLSDKAQTEISESLDFPVVQDILNYRYEKVKHDNSIESNELSEDEKISVDDIDAVYQIVLSAKKTKDISPILQDKVYDTMSSFFEQEISAEVTYDEILSFINLYVITD